MGLTSLQSMASNTRASNYNHLTYRSNGTAIAYNFLWRTMALFSPEEAQCYSSLFDGSGRCTNANIPENSPELSDLHFIVPAGLNELELFRKAYNASFSRPVLTAMILPTLRCNFACPYCFEFKQDIDLSPEIVTALKAWLTQRFEGKRHLHITWFGGEPLLALDTIEDLSRFGNALAAACGKRFSASIVTNGYLLDARKIALLQALQIYNFHITLDGDLADHNRTRFLAESGEGTFDQIRDNIELYCRVSRSHLPLGLRVNVTDQNYSGIQNLLGRFSDTVKKNSRLYFRWVWTSEASGGREFVANQKKPFERLFDLYRAAAREGYFIDNPLDQVQFNYCEVDFAFHYTFDPRGYIYLCSHKFTPDEAVGHVITAPEVEETTEYRTWAQVNPFSDACCIRCKILPLCKGSCRKARHVGRRACVEEKASIDKYVETQYLKHTLFKEIVTKRKEH